MLNRRALGLLAVGLVAAGVSAVSRVRQVVSGGAARPARVGLLSLPVAAQGPVSAALGADDPSYRIRGRRGGLYAVNRAQGVGMSFAPAGLSVRAGSSRLSLALVAAGYGPLRTLHPVAPRAHSNRVSYGRGAIDEWYTNGPLGLEQGFTLSRPLGAAAVAAGGPLALALKVGGNLHPVLASGGRSLSFDAGGVAVLRYRGLVASDASGRALRAWLSLNGGRVLVRVDARGARYPLRIDPFVQVAQLTASNGTHGDALGSSVAISGSTIVAGAPGLNAVYVFSEPASGWQNATQTAELTASDGGGTLGSAVAISGSTIVADAPNRSVGASAGAVYVFSEPASGWHNATQTAELTASDGGGLAFSVAISGSTIAAGANGVSGAGAVYVFSEPASGWHNATQTAELTASDAFNGAAMGRAVAISGSTIAAGAMFGAAGEKGAVDVYTEPASGWQNATQTAQLTASDGATSDVLGSSVAISGSTIAAGAPNHAVGANGKEGAVYVFSEPASGWHNATQTAELTASDGVASDALGNSVAIAGSSIAAASAARSKTGGAGAVYVFSEPASGWGNSTQTDELTAAGGVSGPVAMSASTIAAGTAANNLGSVDVFGTQAAAPPPPVLGKSVDVVPVSGKVFVKLPGANKASAAAISKGTGFVPLTEARQLPSGSEIDARAGTLSLTAAAPVQHGKLQTGVFGGAVFKATQSGSGLQKGLTTLSLLEGAFPGAPSYRSCRSHPAGDGPRGVAASASPTVLQTLHAHDKHGKWRTQGKDSSATAHGTIWDTSDRCDGTLTIVHRGTVDVFDFRLRKTIVVHAGHRYLAKA